jgi:DNA-binding XRE family transcriptional regulator
MKNKRSKEEIQEWAKVDKVARTYLSKLASVMQYKGRQEKVKRVKAECTQTLVAAAIGVKRETVGHVIHGDKTRSINYVYVFRTFFHVHALRLNLSFFYRILCLALERDEKVMILRVPKDAQAPEGAVCLLECLAKNEEKTS